MISFVVLTALLCAQAQTPITVMGVYPEDLPLGPAARTVREKLKAGDAKGALAALIPIVPQSNEDAARLLAVEIAVRLGRPTADPLMQTLRKASGWRLIGVSQSELRDVAAGKSDGRGLAIASVSWKRSDVALALLLLAARLEYDGSEGGRIYRSLGIPPGGARRLSTKVVSANSYAGAWSHLAVVAVLNVLESNLSLVRAEAERIAKRHPNDGAAHVVAGWLWAKGTQSKARPEASHPPDIARALAHARKGARCEPSMLSAHWQLGILANLAQLPEADLHFRTFFGMCDRLGRTTPYERSVLKRLGIESGTKRESWSPRPNAPPGDLDSF